MQFIKTIPDNKHILRRLYVRKVQIMFVYKREQATDNICQSVNKTLLLIWAKT